MKTWRTNNESGAAAVLTGSNGMLSGLLGDDEISAFFSDETWLDAMLEFESALARVQARLGIIPDSAARAIAAAAERLEPDLDAIAGSVSGNGVPVIELVAQLRREVGEPEGDFVHFGATSQDAIDSATALLIGAALGVLRRRLVRLCEALAELAADHRQTIMCGRTRGQQAVPVTFGCKVANWLAPLVRQLERMQAIEARALRVQLGGAAGNLSMLGERGPEVGRALAEELGLNPSPAPWHVQRDAMVETGAWLAMLNQSLAKIADDLWLMAQNEVGEAGFKGKAGSSTMPQKNNPVLAESIQSLAVYSSGLNAALLPALRAEHERGGAAWQLEWLALPRLFVSAGSALNNANRLLDQLLIYPRAMQANLEATNGLVLAEALTYELSRQVSRSRAKELVGAAVADVLESGGSLVDALAADSGLDCDWPALARYENHLGASSEIVDEALRLWSDYSSRHRRRGDLPC